MAVVADRVKETSTSTGTGTIDLAGAVSGFRTFVSGVGSGTECYYAIVGQTPGEWEVGKGTPTSGSPDTLSRTTVLASSDSNALVNFSVGTKDVFVTIAASIVTGLLALPTAFSGARVRSTATQTVSNNTPTVLLFETEDYDTDNYHSTSTNTSRLTVPVAGKYLIIASMAWAANSTGSRALAILLNGATILANEQFPGALAAVTDYIRVVTTMSLAANDYVEARANQTSGGSLGSLPNASYTPVFEIVQLH